MSTKNAILGFCAASLAVGSAVASVLVPTAYTARRSDGLQFKPFTAEQTIVCPAATAKNCQVKLVNSSGVTIPGYTAATVFTAAGAVVVKTTLANSIHTIVISN